MRRRRATVAVASGLAGLSSLLSACTGGTYAATPLPTPTSASAGPGTSASAAPGTPGSAAPASCTNATQSYDPLPALSGAPADNAVRDIKARGYLVAGVSADSLLLASRNPVTGQIEGFDIDIVHAIAQAIFGDPAKVQLVVIQSADRIPALQQRRVDVVVRNMTMTCDRWTQIAFSSEYYQSGLKVLVQKDSPVTTLQGLAGKRVCAPNATSTIETVKATPGVVAVGSATHTGCLVLFQQGQVDAIAGDDTVLAGLVAQDPYAKVPQMPPQTSEPYGVGVAKDRVELVRYVNRVLDSMKADGRWKAMYDKWFAARLGPAPAPPASVYGRAA